MCDSLIVYTVLSLEEKLQFFFMQQFIYFFGALFGNVRQSHPQLPTSSLIPLKRL